MSDLEEALALPSGKIAQGPGCLPSQPANEPDYKPVLSVEKVYSLLDPRDESNTSACLKGAWAVIQQTLQLYSLDELCISFNGGKDCTVLLHILHAALNKLSPPPQQLKALYVCYNSPFPQAEDFISETTQRLAALYESKSNLDWHHADVWSMIRECDIPYCCLYDEGYTSLGSTHNTTPNPALKYEDGSNKYKPAYMLEDGHLERAGRN
ncbi:FAD1 flavin adenine dinucleotide synthetase [Desmophyllum pertusum]|uniref:FAD synthase n=1 Tax=Desmophyllum pertusum TaxID=174260 RepID=A0A9X0A3F5_9CNID|nr:FAD1 flavin adenine dinucleotide synthetase [Desmophyllum pertusum]